MKKLIYILFTVILLVGCENEAQLYQGEEGDVSGIYFLSKNGSQCTDSLEYSFQNDPLSVERKEIPLSILVFGNVKDYPRTFRIKVAGGSAVVGEDYEALHAEYTVPAGSAQIKFPLILIRSGKLLKEKTDVILQLEENEYFKLLVPVVVDQASGRELDATRFRVIFSELITQPQMWATMFASTYFGSWSVNKFRLINDIMGWRVSDWTNFSGPVKPGKFGYAATMLQMYLQEKADMNEPVYEDDGITYMQLGPAYNVDYSGLEAGK